MINIEQYKNKLNEYKGQRNSINKLLSEERTLNKKLSQDALDSTLALDILTYVGRQTQDQLTFRIESLVTTALEYVFGARYKFKAEFDIKRNQTECNLWLEEDGSKIDPIKDTGGTVNDIISAALRISTWSLQTNKSSPMFTMDEPGKFISKNMRGAFSEFLKNLCDKLNIQIIMATHSDEMIESADNIIRIEKNGIYSEVVKND